MKRLLRSPIHWPWSCWFLVLEWTGRRTGRRYQTPVSYVRDGRVLLITTGDAWWKNLTGGAEVDVWVRGRKRRAVAEPLADEGESLALHELMFERRPLFRLLAGIGQSNERDEIRRSIRAGRKLVRLHVVAGGL